VFERLMNLIVVDIQEYQRVSSADFFLALSLTFAKANHSGAWNESEH
jgi:hypothetical protein